MPASKARAKALIAKLRKDPDCIPWEERRDVVSKINESLQSESEIAGDSLDLIQILAHDPKPEVRKEIADLLYHLPEDAFNELAGILSADSSYFVQKAVERALDRRRKGSKALHRLRRNLEQVDTQLRVIEKNHGSRAAERARKLMDSNFSILVGETVHDIRNVLTPIRGTLSKLAKRLEQGNADISSLREELARANERADYLDRFMTEMKEYSQSSPTTRRKERIADVILEAKNLAIENLKGSGFNVSTVTFSVTAPGNLFADITRHQVVIALNHVIRNAVESFEMPGSTTKDRKIDLRAGLNSGNLEFSVQDNGPGIHEEDLQEYRKFHPGQTTKKRYGTGFGLPTAKRCAQAHDGDLSIHSELGRGTTVTMVLSTEDRAEE